MDNNIYIKKIKNKILVMINKNILIFNNKEFLNWINENNLSNMIKYV